MTFAVDIAKAEKAYTSLKGWATRLKVKYTTVHGWKRAQKIPEWRLPRIIETAREDGKDIFADPPKAKKRRAA